MYINGKFYRYRYFLYDGCHKIFLIHRRDFKEAFKAGYSKDDIRLVEELPDIYIKSCPLRFIARWDNLEDDIAEQGAKSVSFKTRKEI